MGLFDSSSSSKTTCPSLITGPQYGVDNIIGSLTFHRLTIVLCGAFTAITVLFSAVQLFLHATHFSSTTQQTQIIRILALAPTFALAYFLAGSVPSAAIYVQPWADAYESVALASYFILLVTYTEPNPQLRDAFFDRLPQPKSDEGSLRWYHRTWFFVFQYVVVATGVAIATDITQAAGKYCLNGHSLHFAHIWLTIIHTVSVALAFVRLLQYYRRLRPTLKPHSVGSKLIAIKGIVFLNFLQTIIFTILFATGAGKPSSKLSSNDIYFGIPSILTCGEMVLFSLFNFFAFNLHPYVLPPSGASQPLARSAAHYQGGILGLAALLKAVNPTEIIQGLVLAVRYITGDRAPQGFDSVPLRPGGGSAGSPPAYMAPGLYQGDREYQRAKGSNAVEYGRVERYTPLSN